MRLQGRHLLVTGAGSGIGRAVAVAVAAEGARVSLLGRDASRLAETASLLGGAAAGQFSVDLASASAVRQFAQQFSSALPQLDGLVHAAGDFQRRSIGAVVASEAMDRLAANAVGPLILTSSLLPQLRQARGDVIFVNSSIALRGGPGLAEYSMSKAAMHTLAESLRAEENAHGVRVTSVYVGRTATPMQERVARAEGSAYRPERLLQPEDVAAVIVSALTLPHSAEVTDLHIRPRMPPA
jgi:NAD(P)-dependent dehydrogenase (short-subunit alcohol dehydrogenase family)